MNRNTQADDIGDLALSSLADLETIFQTISADPSTSDRISKLAHIGAHLAHDRAVSLTLEMGE